MSAPVTTQDTICFDLEGRASYSEAAQMKTRQRGYGSSITARITLLKSSVLAAAKTLRGNYHSNS